MELKKVFQNEIYWTLKQWNVEQQANIRIKELLGEELAKYFAKCNVGAGFYTWTTPTGRWTSLEHASSEDIAEAHRKWDELKQQVRARLTNHTEVAERIISVPNDNFIFFRHREDGSMSIIITGWGFSKSYRPPVTPIVAEKNVKGQQVTVGFISDGEKVPNRPFQIVAERKNNNLITDTEGNCSLGKLDIGKVVTLIDTLSGKPFSFRVDALQTEYLFDVTEPKPEPVPEPEPEPNPDPDIVDEPIVTTDKEDLENELQEQKVIAKHNPWLELLMWILLILTLITIGIGFYYGIDGLSDIINQNIL